MRWKIYKDERAYYISNEEGVKKYYSVVMERWEDNFSTPYNKKGWISEIVNTFQLGCQNKE